MEIVTSVKDFQNLLSERRNLGEDIGFVPTMGALHGGHTSLVDTSVRQEKTTVVSIFVNPLQFSDEEDLDDYPSSLEKDEGTCLKHKVDLLFCPTQKEIYPKGVPEPEDIGEIGKILEGKSRPSHFQGVATVVARLFEIVGEACAYFGEKDFQQMMVVNDLVKRHRFPVEIVACPTIRQIDGLALSSRNVYLTEEQRADAPVLYRALIAGAELISEGERKSENLKKLISSIVVNESKGDLDYVGIVDSETFTPLDSLNDSGKQIRILIACDFGTTRLIDNVGVVIP
ncbi:MAG: pantoate--beta-alanine ligase [Acidimicrobiaceae bacterium]|nr:pantoate--beta-alanine ligase [Acidimicrobiaceae bacterium]|tara:strand:- start:14727 stop:15584 length:858 start_codon:yes stop_codon:yes gene_type:complete